MIIVWGVLGTIAFSCILAFIPDMIDFCKKRKKRWLTVPEDDQYRQVILTFTDFHKFYVANPNAYELKKGFMHPFRDKYFIQEFSARILGDSIPERNAHIDLYRRKINYSTYRNFLYPVLK